MHLALALLKHPTATVNTLLDEWRQYLQSPQYQQEKARAQSPFSRHIVFDFRRMSGELVIRFDSEDPCWWRYKSVEDVLERMQHGIFHSSLPPLPKAPPPCLGLPVLEEYQLVYDGTFLSGDWDNIDLPFGATVYILLLRAEVKKPVRDWSVGMRTWKDIDDFREEERRFEAAAKGYEYNAGSSGEARDF